MLQYPTSEAFLTLKAHRINKKIPMLKKCLYKSLCLLDPTTLKRR